jgi:hypothetical protein
MSLCPKTSADRPSAPSSPQSPRLLNQVRAALRVRHYALRPEESYVYWIRQEKGRALRMAEP